METTFTRKRRRIKIKLPAASAKPGGEVKLMPPDEKQPRTKHEWDLWRWLQIGVQLNLQP